MIVLVATYECKPGKGDEVLGHLQRMAPLVAEREPGCKMYQICRGTENPDQFLLYEHYVDQAALDAHRETPHFQEIVMDTITPLLDKRERAFYDLAIE